MSLKKIIVTMNRCSFCSGMLDGVLQVPKLMRNYAAVRQLSTTTVLNKKNMTRKYNPKVRPFIDHGAAYRYVRGLDTSLSRYGPLADRPDYTYLDGRPTPLTPDQMKERQNRKEIAEKVVEYMKEMKEVKSYVHEVKPKLIQEEQKKTLDRKLKAKS